VQKAATVEASDLSQDSNNLFGVKLRKGNEEGPAKQYHH
jgi:hypothetical protein